MPRDRRHIIILPLAALIAVLPLILRGCSCGHDFDFHIINWFEAAKQFTHGTLHPHWADTPAWNAGEPRFVFYPPLSWTLGALLGLILPWTWTPIVYTWLVLTAAGFALHYAARSFATPNAALIAAAVYLANPYTLYTAYERSAYGELLAAAWLPLLLYGILRERVTIPGIAIPIALLWLSNAPAAVMGCYALGLLALLRLALSFKRPNFTHVQFIATTVAGALLGLGLGAFYIIPAAYERRFVQIGFAVLPGLSPQENFLFHRTTDVDHDSVLRTASFTALVLIALTVISLVLLIRRGDKPKSGDEPGAPSSPRSLRLRWTSREGATPAYLIPSLALLALAIAFMLTPLSASLWRYLPHLVFLQFPWRLTAILATIFGLSLGIALSRLSLGSAPTIIAALLAAATLTIPASIAFQQRCYPEDTLPERLTIFRSAAPGTDPTDEYTPTTADNDALTQHNPGYWLASDPSAPAPDDAKPGPGPRNFEIDPAAPTTLILNLRDYPAWRITRNGLPVAARLHRDDGLIAVPVPVGPSRIESRYVTLHDQQLGYLVSSFSLLLLTALIVLSRLQPPGSLEAKRASDAPSDLSPDLSLKF